MVYQFRVTLAGIKGFYRVYRMDGTRTLYEFHKQMRADMEFMPCARLSKASSSTPRPVRQAKERGLVSISGQMRSMNGSGPIVSI